MQELVCQLFKLIAPFTLTLDSLTWIYVWPYLLVTLMMMTVSVRPSGVKYNLFLNYILLSLAYWLPGFDTHGFLSHCTSLCLHKTRTKTAYHDFQSNSVAWYQLILLIDDISSLTSTPSPNDVICCSGGTMWMVLIYSGTWYFHTDHPGFLDNTNNKPKINNSNNIAHNILIFLFFLIATGTCLYPRNLLFLYSFCDTCSQRNTTEPSWWW